eukprot:jgi/Hompol1/6113/HPOL_000706-RA
MFASVVFLAVAAVQIIGVAASGDKCQVTSYPSPSVHTPGYPKPSSVKIVPKPTSKASTTKSIVKPTPTNVNKHVPGEDPRCGDRYGKCPGTLCCSHYGYPQWGRCNPAPVPPKPDPHGPVGRNGGDIPVDHACLDAHNQARRICGVRPLVWDDSLARAAKYWANYLESRSQEHSQMGHGENLDRFYAPVAACTYGVSTWFSERYKYHGQPIGQSSGPFTFEDYGHFTQLCWDETVRVGCFTTKHQVVCEYDPP